MFKKRFTAFCIGAGLTLIILAVLPTLENNRPALAQDEEEPIATEEPEPSVAANANVTGNNAYCLLCHAQTSQTLTFEDGREISLHVDPQVQMNSVHGAENREGPLGCVDCHGEDAFPHDDPLPDSGRLYSIQAAQICTNCHTEQGSELRDGVHALGLHNGNERAATCVDCHGTHDVQPVRDHPELAAHICGDCHRSIFSEYEESIHGEALLEQNVTDAPTCIDCHGVHGINDPTTAQARNRSPQLCATCHADEDLMEEYGISTNVFNSYLSDFHGTTVAMFNQQGEDVPSNKAVCYDCHGVHNITPADDSKSQVAKENLLVTCQQCHPNATSDFPDAWVGHFEPTADDNLLLFGVEWFYRILIPTILGGFAVMVVADIFGRLTGKHHK